MLYTALHCLAGRGGQANINWQTVCHLCTCAAAALERAITNIMSDDTKYLDYLGQGVSIVHFPQTTYS